MKLSDALARKQEIDELVSRLNAVINNAAHEGMYIDVEILERHTMSVTRVVPVIHASIKVNPQDID